MLAMMFTGCAVLDGIGQGLAAPSTQRAIERNQPRPQPVLNCTTSGTITQCF